MTLVVAIVILIGVVGLIGVPLLISGTPHSRALGASSNRLQLLLDDRDMILAAMKDLETDFANGKLDAAEYGQLRETYEQQAVRVLRILEASGAGLEEAIEAEIATERKLHSAAESPGATVECPRCGIQHGNGDARCIACGLPVAARE